MSLLRQGQAWLDIYNYTVKERDIAKLEPGIYCLFSALEMYIKGYIVLKNSDYSDLDKLKKLGHKFSVMYERLAEVAPSEFKQQVKTQLDHYKLMTLDINRLKYPEVRGMWSVDNGLEKGVHTFGAIFAFIEKEIIEGMESWMNTAYPKTSHIGVLLHGREQAISYEQAKGWLALCPSCRPEHVSVSLQVSWPWCLEDEPYQSCSKCKKYYQADRFGLST